MFDVSRVREDFPVLAREVHGKPLVYLDNAATSQKPRAVIQALVDYYERYNANIHRGIHTLSEEATAAYEDARARVARFINAPSPDTVVFTRNATEAINLVAYAWGRKHVGHGDEVLITEMEHHSNIVPWFMLAAERGAQVRFIPLTAEGYLDLDQAAALLTPRTKLLALTHMSNVLGTINPVADLCRLAHERGALCLVDGAQSVPHLPVDVQAIDCDFLAFSSHKMLGPTGVGVLYGKKALLQEMDPFMGGGDMIRTVTFEGATWNDLPWKFEAGTPNIADVIAFGAAIEYLERLGMERVRAHEREIVAYTLDRLQQFEEIVVYGPKDPDRRGGVVSFNLGDVHPHDLGTVLDQEGVAIRAGHHCCQPLMIRLGVSGTARASFYIYNTHAEVDALCQALRKAKELFGRVGLGRRAV